MSLTNQTKTPFLSFSPFKPLLPDSPFFSTNYHHPLLVYNTTTTKLCRTLDPYLCLVSASPLSARLRPTLFRFRSGNSSRFARTLVGHHHWHCRRCRAAAAVAHRLPVLRYHSGRYHGHPVSPPQAITVRTGRRNENRKVSFCVPYVLCIFFLSFSLCFNRSIND